MTTRIRGVLAPVVTPFDASGSPDAGRLLQHCLWLQRHDVGLAVFGTNSEANSLSLDERLDLLDRLIEGGVAPERMMPGTGCCAVTDSIRLTSRAVAHGVAGCLMLPPFYYKAVSTEGLYRNFATVIERVGDARLRIYLYHIPPVAQVGFGFDLIERLLREFPGTIAGIKDSSGDWNHTQRLLTCFGGPGFDVFAGSETFLLANLRNGGAGCISATANVNPAALVALVRRWQSSDADTLQAGADVIRGIFQRRPMIAAMKHAIAHWRDDPEWVRLRPPLVELAQAEGTALIRELTAADFSLPALAAH
ncbi:MAG TPA: dihydrodipicolinate synthase family protein [Burkholderiaceae bacterium]|nr:dihydrodipicolinate synthase family protein [Burkholderiaceae bacterium]